MAIRKIRRQPVEGRNYYVIDACFLANKYIPTNRTPNNSQRNRVERCLEWWKEIDTQLCADKARVYVPDLCIAEALKVLAKKYYVKHWFRNSTEYSNAKKRMVKEITIPPKELIKTNRKILYHDVSTSRDLIIAVDRFFETYFKHGQQTVSLTDLVIPATAKYLMDFFDIPSKRIHIVTLDKSLKNGAKWISELPYVYDPTKAEDSNNKVFTG